MKLRPADKMITREAALAARGWQKKSTIDEPRLSELVQVYRQIGYDVHLEPFDPSQQADCSRCMQAAPDRYQTIYIRKTGNGQAADDDML